jgi:hypothetical protein
MNADEVGGPETNHGPPDAVAAGQQFGRLRKSRIGPVLRRPNSRCCTSSIKTSHWPSTSNWRISNADGIQQNSPAFDVLGVPLGQPAILRKTGRVT